MAALADTLALFVRSAGGWVFAGVWGALWGSFFNVAIHRVGLYESVVRPRSRCPKCGHAISAADNIPILSWLLLGGRCRRCRDPISVRYPLVEALTALLALGVWWRFVALSAVDGVDPVWLLARFFYYFAFVGTLLVLGGIDLDHLLLPDQITYPAIPIFLVAGILVGEVPALDRLIGAVLGYGLVALTAELSYLILRREGMGYGDAKLLALCGAAFGWRGVLVVFFGAPFMGLVVVPPLLLWRRRKVMGVEIPYGPFLVVAALAYVYAGHLLPAPLTFTAP